MPTDVQRLIEEQRIHTVYQPILDRHTGEPFGFEALARGPADSQFHAPARLFAEAARIGRLPELERACTRAAVRGFADLKVDGRLFLNVLPETLLRSGDFAQWLIAELRAAAVDPHSVVIELTEHGLVPHEVELADAIRPLRRIGCDIAIDDLGAGSSGLKTWSAVRPEFVKVDRYFVAGIEEDPVRGEILRSVVEMGRATGSRIVAEGIENRAEQLALPIPAVPATTLVATVVENFQRNPSWRAVCVVEGSRPIGLVRRDELLIFLSRPLHPEIYNRKSVVAVMDDTAIQIDARARLEQVSRLVTGQEESRQKEDFIITRAGEYLGLGRTIDLLRQITVQQIQVARQANPLTGLPGNREIQAQLTQLINRRRAFIACHLDLDNFKPFNDTYGYQQGDQVLLHVATTLTRNTRPRVDFVGHLGGDDFVLLLRSRDWSLRLQSLLDDLSVSLINFHSSEHREAKQLVAHGRDGVLTSFPLLSVSVAAVEVTPTSAATLESVAEELRRTKGVAKARSGCSCMLSTGNRVVDLLAGVNLPALQDDTAQFRALG